MRRTVDTKPSRWTVVITVVSLSLLWLLAAPRFARADCPGCVCTLKVVAEDKVVSVMTNNPEDFSLAILVPPADNINVPILCDSLGTLALAVANQANQNINVAVEIFTNQGGSAICVKGPFLLAVNGGIGMTFADCP